MNLIRGEIGGRLAANQKAVILCPAGQGGDAGLRTAGGNIADLKEARKAHVGRLHLFGDCIQHLSLDASLLVSLDDGGKALERQREGRVLGLLAGKLFHLFQRLGQKIGRRHAMVRHADGYIGGYLVKGAWDRVQAGDPVVVVLDGGEAELGRQLRVGGLDAAQLGYGHLPLLELHGFLIIGKPAQQQIPAGFLLLGEAVGIDGGKLEHEVDLAGQPVVDGLHGVVGDLVVVALVAQGRSELGIMLEAVFPVVLKEGVEGLAAVFHRGGRSGEGQGELRPDRRPEGEQQERGGGNGVADKFFQGKGTSVRVL